MNQQKENKTFYLYFNTRDELYRVDLFTVAYFEADRNYTEVFFTNGMHVMLTTSLLNVEGMLNAEGIRGKIPSFVRLGRSLIVNLDFLLHVNILKQELVVADMYSTHPYKLSASREALKKLKELYTQGK